MNHDKKIHIGKITNAQCIKGWLKILSFTSPPENIIQYSSWIIHKVGKEQVYTVVEGKQNNNKIIVKLRNIEDRTQAEKLKNSEIKIMRSELPNLGDQKYYWSDLEGLKVKNMDQESIGIVDSLFETGANDVLVVKGKNNKRILIPFVLDEIIKEVNIDLEYIKVDWSI
jgi:16S rRNA processing protein RimM